MALCKKTGKSLNMGGHKNPSPNAKG